MINLNSIEMMNDINELKWNSRVLVIKNDKKNNFSLRINSLKQEFDERDFVLVYVKEQNTFVHNKKMSNEVKDSKLVIIPEVKHSFLIEAPEQIANNLIEFIENI